ncbi:MAG: hypothetical protein K8R85_15620 [Bacteroidetes bacterium]|nr:hypothetical protein [Bacteroidota bacterium]
MSKTKLPEGVTETQIQEWKDKHGKVKLITCKRDKGEEAVFIIGQPTRDIMDAWAHAYDNDKRQKAREILENSCVLHGDKTLFVKDINLQTTVLKKVQEMLENLQAEEKEL